MIDIETDVFNAVYEAVAPLVPEGGFTSEYVPAPSAFPHASLMEIDNIPYLQSADSATLENHAVVSFESNVYARTRQECRDVMKALDDAMIGLGFKCSVKQSFPNEADPTLYRMVARYSGVVDHNKVIYR